MILYNVRITKHFTAGMMKGLTFEDSLKRVTRSSLTRILADEKSGKIINPVAGSSSYYITNVTHTFSI